MTAPRQRELWADSARGLAIMAVVLGHVFLQEDPNSRWSMWQPAEFAWVAFRDMLLPVRMPLFFLIAGYFASHVLVRPWRTVIRTRTLNLYYLYFVWLLIQTAFFAVVPHPGTASASNVDDFFAQLTYAPNNLWFLVALAVYFVVAKVGARVRIGMLIGSAVLCYVAFAYTLPDLLETTPMPEYLFFFLLGAYAPGVLRRIRGSVPVIASGLLVLFIGVSAMNDATDSNWWTTLLLCSTVAGVTAIVSLLKLLESRDALPRLTVWIGRRTLPIYVVQLPLVIAVGALLDLLPADDAQALLGNPVVSVLYPLLVTAVVIAGAVALHTAVSRPAPWLYRAPWLSPARKQRVTISRSAV